MADPEKQDRPVPDFDHLPLATLQNRVRSLDLDGLERVAAGPKQNPPSHGVPSNPAHPRPTG